LFQKGKYTRVESTSLFVRKPRIGALICCPEMKMYINIFNFKQVSFKDKISFIHIDKRDDQPSSITVNIANNQMDRTTRPTYVGRISLIHTHASDDARVRKVIWDVDEMVQMVQEVVIRENNLSSVTVRDVI